MYVIFCMPTALGLIHPMQNSDARLILRAPGHQSCTPLSQPFHWLPSSERIRSNTNLLLVLQFNHWFGSLLSVWPTTAVQPFPLSPLFIRLTHTQTPTFHPKNSWLSFFLLLQFNHLEQPLPDVRDSTTLSAFKTGLYSSSPCRQRKPVFWFCIDLFSCCHRKECSWNYTENAFQNLWARSHPSFAAVWMYWCDCYCFEQVLWQIRWNRPLLNLS